MDKLKALRFFCAVGERLSFAEAARTFGTSPSTISKAIKRLESELGLALFNRNTRIIRLSNFGQEYLNTAKKILYELDSCEQGLLDQASEISGTLKINVPVSYGRLYIQPLLKRFHKIYPKLAIEILYDDAYTDIVDRSIDITIRSGTLPDSGLIARKLSPIDFLICAPKHNFSLPNAFDDIDQLLGFTWVCFRYKQSGKIMPITFINNGHISEYIPKKKIVVDDGESLAELCADGCGLSQIPHFIAKKWIDNNKIAPLFSPYSPDRYGVFALYQNTPKTPAKIKVFIDYLQKYLHSIGETSRTTWARNTAGCLSIKH